MNDRHPPVVYYRAKMLRLALLATLIICVGASVLHPQSRQNVRYFEIGKSVRGRSITASVHGNGEKRVIVLAAIQTVLLQQLEGRPLRLGQPRECSRQALREPSGPRGPAPGDRCLRPRSPGRARRRPRSAASGGFDPPDRSRAAARSRTPTGGPAHPSQRLPGPGACGGTSPGEGRRSRADRAHADGCSHGDARRAGRTTSRTRRRRLPRSGPSPRRRERSFVARPVLPSPSRGAETDRRERTTT